MASVLKRVRKEPMPAGAQIVERKGRRMAEWVDAKGKRRTAAVSKDGLGIRVQSSTYTVQYMDEHGHPQRLASRCTDFDAAMQLGREKEKQAMQRREGLVDPTQERFSKAARQSIREHAAEYAAYLRAGGRTGKHVDATERYLTAIFTRCGMERLSDLRSPAVMAAIDDIRRGVPVGKQKQRPASLSLCNAYLKSLKGFSRWLLQQRRSAEDALLDLKIFNAETDRRHVRRELTANEVQWLLEVTERRTLPEHGAAGPIRAMCYRLAGSTGFRANELKSLTTDSFSLDAIPPTCTVEAGYSKRRKRDVQPLPPAMVEPLRAWLAGMEPGSKVFADIAAGTARMLRSDLRAARQAWLEEALTGEERSRREQTDFLLYEDRQGHVADFHSLRVLFISRVVAGGASVREAQTLARHSTPLLTFNTYSRASLLDVAGAVAGVGEMLTAQPVRSEPEQARATGTSGGPAAVAPVDHLFDHTQPAADGFGWHSAALTQTGGGLEPRAAHQAALAAIRPKTPVEPRKTGAEGMGFEPTIHLWTSDFESDRWPIRLPSESTPPM